MRLGALRGRRHWFGWSRRRCGGLRFGLRCRRRNRAVGRRPGTSIADTHRLDHQLGQFGVAFRRLRGLEAREGDDLLGVRVPVESNDRRLAQDRLDNASRADRVVADRGTGAGPGVRGEDHALADAEGWRRLLACAGWASGCRRWTGHRRDDHRSRDRDDLLLVVIVVVIVDLDDDPDLDLDLVGVVQFDGVSLEHLGDRDVRFFLIGVDGGVGWFLGHSGSYVWIGRLRCR